MYRSALVLGLGGFLLLIDYQQSCAIFDTDLLHVYASELVTQSVPSTLLEKHHAKKAYFPESHLNRFGCDRLVHRTSAPRYQGFGQAVDSYRTGQQYGLESSQHQV